MISKEDQTSWLKTECARGFYARQCYEKDCKRLAVNMHYLTVQ